MPHDDKKKKPLLDLSFTKDFFSGVKEDFSSLRKGEDAGIVDDNAGLFSQILAGESDSSKIQNIVDIGLTNPKDLISNKAKALIDARKPAKEEGEDKATGKTKEDVFKELGFQERPLGELITSDKPASPSGDLTRALSPLDVKAGPVFSDEPQGVNRLSEDFIINPDIIGKIGDSAGREPQGFVRSVASSIGNILSNPAFKHAMGTIAIALDPKGSGAQLGALGIQQAKDRIATSITSEILESNDPEATLAAAFSTKVSKYLDAPRRNELVKIVESKVEAKRLGQDSVTRGEYYTAYAKYLTDRGTESKIVTINRDPAGRAIPYQYGWNAKTGELRVIGPGVPKSVDTTADKSIRNTMFNSTWANSLRAATGKVKGYGQIVGQDGKNLTIKFSDPQKMAADLKATFLKQIQTLFESGDLRAEDVKRAKALVSQIESKKPGETGTIPLEELENFQNTEWFN